MKISRNFLILSAAIILGACGTSKQFRTKPTIVVDSKPVPADTIVTEVEDENSVVIDSSNTPSVNPDSIPFVNSTEDWKNGIREGIDNILDNPLLETSVCGVEVWDLDDDVSLYRHDQLQRLRPASTMKVMTAITALYNIGTDYNFSTKVYYTGNEPDSVHTWKGDIYIVGGMDPLLSAADITLLAREMKQQGVDSLMGNIYADQSFKDNKKYGSGWCWDDDHNPLLLPLKFNNKDEVAYLFSKEMERSGVYFDGNTGTSSMRGKGRLIAEKQRPLERVMRPMLKNSNNNCAEGVFYAMTHDKYGNGATAGQAQRMIRSVMKDAGVSNADSYDFVDGCGLSLYDYVSPHAEVMMLRYAWDNKDIYHFLYPLLPVAGRDGTLRKRMIGTSAAGNVHAKTGTVTGIRSLCGYLTSSNGHHLAFSIMNQGVNGDDGTAQKAKNLQDRICELLTSPNPSKGGE